MKHKRAYLMSDFYCTQCGSRGFPVWRRKGEEREKGHLKKLFCLKCNKETNHIEIRDYSNYDYNTFKLEFEYGNFNSDGTREKTLKELKVLIDNGKIEKQKTLCDGGSSGGGEEHLD